MVETGGTSAVARAITVAVRLDRLPPDAGDGLVALLKSVADGVLLELVTVQHGAEDGGYFHVSFFTPDHVRAWTKLHALYDDSEQGRQLAASTIVVCESDEGLPDYLLLHHFDPDEKVAVLPTVE